MNRHERQARIDLGMTADALMTNPAFAAAVEKYRAELFHDWKAATELAVRERLWLESQALEGVMARLSALRLAGDVARSRT